MAEKEAPKSTQYDLSSTQEQVVYGLLYDALIRSTEFEINSGGMAAPEQMDRLIQMRRLFVTTGENLGKIDKLSTSEKINLGLYGELSLDDLEELERDPNDLLFEHKVEYARGKVVELLALEAATATGE